MKKSFLKSLLPLLLALPCLAGLSSCHGNSGGLPAFRMPSSFDTSRDYTITFWAKNDNNKKQVAVYDDAVAKFEGLYPNIHVEIKKYTDYSVIYQDVITNIPTNTTPNVCISYPDHIATYLTGTNIVAPLDEMEGDEKYGLGGSEIKFDAPEKSELISKFADECVINGKQYALPYMRSSEAVYINKNYVEALGYTIPDILTWDWIYEVADKAMEKNADGTFKINGQSTMIPFIYKSTDNMMISALKQKGAPYSNDKGDILMFKDEGKAGTTQILEDIRPHAAKKSFSTFTISGYPANFLNMGQCVFAIDSTAGSTWMGYDAPTVDMDRSYFKKFETVVRPIPQYDVSHPKMISQGPSLCVFNKSDPQTVLASWIFAQYLLTNEVQLAYAETEGYIPVTQKAINSEEYQDYLARRGEDNETHYSVKIDASKLVIDNIDNTFVTAVFNGSASLRQAAGQAIEKVVKAAKINSPITDYDGLYSDLISLYRLDQKADDVGKLPELGSISGGAIALLATLGTIWAGIIAYFVIKKIKGRKKKKPSSHRTSAKTSYNELS